MVKLELKPKQRNTVKIQEIADDLISKGYRIISSDKCQISRIEKPDWKDSMIEDRNIEWYMTSFTRPGQAESHYRRFYSKDQLIVPESILEKIPLSSLDPIGYVEVLKFCKRCKKDIPIEKYSRHKATKDGYQPICKVCDRDKQREWYQKNKEKEQAKRLKWQEENRELHNKHAREYQKRKKNNE